jgi:peroxiredoxin
MQVTTFIGRRALVASATALIAAFSFNSLTAAAAPATGQAAPAFKAVDSNGQTLSLDQYRGKTVILEWTNHQCPYVKKHYESNNMQALQKETTAQGVVWLSIISSAPGKEGFLQAADANRLSKERGAAPTRILLDPSGELGHLYSARTTPHMFVIDPAGKLVYMGGIDDKPTADKSDLAKAKNLVRAALSDLGANRPVATPVSQPYGCSVKYAS